MIWWKTQVMLLQPTNLQQNAIEIQKSFFQVYCPFHIQKKKKKSRLENSKFFLMYVSIMTF